MNGIQHKNQQINPPTSPPILACNISQRKGNKSIDFYYKSKSREKGAANQNSQPIENEKWGENSQVEQIERAYLDRL